MPTTTWADARRRARRASKTPTQTSSNTPAQVEGSPAVARRLGDTCEGLVNPNMDGPCVDGFPNGWGRHGTRAAGDCVDTGDDEIYDLSNSRPQESIGQELPAGSVRGAGTTVEITFKVSYASLRGDGMYASSPEAPIELFVWFLNPENGQKFFRQFNWNYRHDSNSNGRKTYWDTGTYSFELVEQGEWVTKILSVADMEIPPEYTEVAAVMVNADGWTDESYVSYLQIHGLESCVDAEPSSSPTTGAPTFKSTPTPSLSPTRASTKKPSAAPTVNPTPKPSSSPMPAPTPKSSAAPTWTPTSTPTPGPSEAPTYGPSSPQPSNDPSSHPTPNPSYQPTPTPTLEAGSPSASPIFLPTQRPSSYAPTGGPATYKPSPKPTEAESEPEPEPEPEPESEPEPEPESKNKGNFIPWANGWPFLTGGGLTIIAFCWCWRCKKKRLECRNKSGEDVLDAVVADKVESTTPSAPPAPPRSERTYSVTVRSETA